MCYAANAITGCVHSVTSSTIDAILLDYNGTSTVPINPEQFGRADVTDFTNVTKVSPMKTLVILITFLNMVNNLRIYMYIVVDRLLKNILKYNGTLTYQL